ncbi:hypothetical protein D3C72_926240 [compost metagenome]
MISIAAHPKADNFSINLGAAFFGVLVLFQHHHAGTVTQNKTITVLVPRAAGCLRIFVAGRQRACCAKAADAQRGTGFFCPTGQHDVSIIVSNDTRGVADVVHT